jgi:hypothetical protein
MGEIIQMFDLKHQRAPHLLRSGGGDESLCNCWLRGLFSLQQEAPRNGSIRDRRSFPRRGSGRSRRESGSDLDQDGSGRSISGRSRSFGSGRSRWATRLVDNSGRSRSFCPRKCRHSLQTVFISQTEQQSHLVSSRISS